jgi:hypothetical protein
MAETVSRRGTDAWIAAVEIQPASGLWGVYTERTTHLEVFAYPQDLLSMLRSVE